jgi:myosin-18
MEEEAVQPGGSEDTLLERLFSYYGPDQGDNKGHALLLKSDKPHHFLLGHSHGTDWVEYDAQGWLNHAKQNPASQNAATLLQDSQKYTFNSLIVLHSSTFSKKIYLPLSLSLALSLSVCLSVCLSL